MRIVIDLQGAQTTGSRLRGIGRYSLSLAQAISRQAGEHDIWLALSGLFPDTIEPLRAAFDNLIPQERIVVWYAPGPVAEIDSRNGWRQKAGERLRESFLASLNPDVMLISSLFEGLGDDALTSVGVFECKLSTAVALYDLIPLLHPTIYLNNRTVESWYQRKLGSLRRAQLWLAISESSRQEGINLLQLPEEWVVNISTAADAIFKPISLSADKVQAVRQRYNLMRSFVMYTGGIDYRKNIEGLIRAYAKLPGALRTRHQLAIVCSASESQIGVLKCLAAESALAPDEVVFTGFIPNADMVALYNLCTAFVFPSWHEGFGLPALEAMACGAAVIGANTSSLPEVIGWSDALFDPFSENDIAAKLYTVLTDGSLREQLKRHGLEQAKKFSWDRTARCAIQAFERLHVHNRARANRINVSGPRRPRLAYISPLPPEKSGIANYSAELLPELARHYDIEVVVHQSEVVDPWIQANCPIRAAEWFEQNAHRYDRVLYHFGNSAFHRHMFRLLERHPGSVVLHDFFLSGVISYMDMYDGSGAWAGALYASHGYSAVAERFTAQDKLNVVWKYPANLSILQRAEGIIVHSEFSRVLGRQWYDAGLSADWECVPHLRKPMVAADRGAARASFGLNPGDFLFCAFGMVGPTKLNHRLLEAWLASPLAQDSRCHLVFVGENHGGEYGANLLRTIGQSATVQPIRITGFAPPSVYRSYLLAADAAVQLRAMSRGETSGTVLDCMNYGLPTIVNAHGAMAEIPHDCVMRLPDEFSNSELKVSLEQLWSDPPFREALGKRARAHIFAHHHPRKVADQYQDVIERFAEMSSKTRTARLLQSIVGLDVSPGNESEWVAVARAVTINQPLPKGHRQLLVDISQLVQHDVKSEIREMMSNLTRELLTRPPEGYRVEPVYASDDGCYRYARRFTMRFLSCPDVGWVDELVEVTSGDIFLGLDPIPHIALSCASTYADLRRRGVYIFSVIYDLSRINHPDRFSEGALEEFSRWLRCIAEFADGAVCVSRTMADKLVEWLNETRLVRQRSFKIGWFPLGNPAPKPSADEVLPGVDITLDHLRRQTTVLMVGCIEPSKGYRSLEAFESVWNRGVEVNLVIVGKLGRKTEALIDRLRRHPKAKQRLYRLESVTDGLLRELHETVDGILMTSEEEFGLPISEAAQPTEQILARDIPVFRKLVGEHAGDLSGTSAELLAESLQNWLATLANGKARRSDAIPYLTWAESARRLLEVIIQNRWFQFIRVDSSESKD